jgi:pimeloyl-ACP methyl ester carboxylesterase
MVTFTNVPTPKITTGTPVLCGIRRNGASYGHLCMIYGYAKPSVPTLVTHGEADWIVPIQAAGHRTAKLGKGANLAAIKSRTGRTHGQHLPLAYISGNR